jgi:hypothetical protein
LFDPKCFSLISRSTADRPMSRLTFSFSLKPAIPVSKKKALGLLFHLDFYQQINIGFHNLLPPSSFSK